jgi:regulator of replication initiation timing
MKIKPTTAAIVINMLALQLKCTADHIVKLEDELKQAQLHLEARIDQNIRDCNDQFKLEQRIVELEKEIEALSTKFTPQIHQTLNQALADLVTLRLENTDLKATITKLSAIIDKQNDADVIAVLGEPEKTYKSLPEGCKIPAGFEQLAYGDIIQKGDRFFCKFYPEGQSGDSKAGMKVGKSKKSFWCRPA